MTIFIKGTPKEIAEAMRELQRNQEIIIDKNCLSDIDIEMSNRQIQQD